MNGSYLLDTNIVIAIFANDRDVLYRTSSASHLFLPSVVLGELYFGAYKSANSKSNIAVIDRFASKSSVLVCDAETAKYYGRIKDHLKAKGTPIPENDIWISALAKQHQLTLITRDRHFRVVKGIHAEEW